MKNRRSILKTAIIAGLGSITSQTASATNNGEEGIEFRGISYDSTTLQHQGNVTANFILTEEQLLLSIPGHSSSFDVSTEDFESTRINTSATRHDFPNKGGEVIIHGLVEGDFFTGFVTRSSREYSNLGFTCISEESQLNRGSIVTALPSAKNSPILDILSSVPEVPSKGIPRNTTALNINHLMEEGE